MNTVMWHPTQGIGKDVTLEKLLTCLLQLYLEIGKDVTLEKLLACLLQLYLEDSFYCGLTPEESKLVHEYNFDHPDAFDTEQLLECVEILKSGLSVHVPIYDFKTHQRSSDSFRQVNASDVIILEGILVFHDQRGRNLMNMKIFVDADKRYAYPDSGQRHFKA
ncbi:hypothetical protein ACS0TY_001769 [Phlomoides rotata]